MKILKRLSSTILIFLLFFVITGCISRAKRIEIQVTKQPVLRLEKPTLLLPFVIEGKNIDLMDDIEYKFFLNLKNNLRKDDLHYKMHYSMPKLNSVTESIIKNEVVDTGIFHRTGLKYLMTAKLIVGEEFYSTYSEDTKINPDYSAEKKGDPVFLEKASSWRARAMDDLSLSIRIKLFIYNIDTAGVVYSKVFEEKQILEDFRSRNLQQAKLQLYNVIIQKLADIYQKEFRVHKKTVRRNYIR
ncbi:MAG: hypothetical protein FXF47_06430 [Candidatus Mcinerneyibacterium aminivorans]|uniref:Uncharacterized protein n=1 Tax=Candidatus Mcinerneyibacterium aminivorans TaxID=2703815 RepID=A0A5D0MDI4_9BACT|nr:MAG: hypothetical protein FXF47_06430 [Candidatus Mcinerneyibacterium aminivorans]